MILARNPGRCIVRCCPNHICCRKRRGLVRWRRHRPNWFRYSNRRSRPTFFVALRGVGIALRYETIPGIKHPTFGIDPKAFRDCFSAAACHFARIQIDGLATELAFRLR